MEGDMNKAIKDNEKLVYYILRHYYPSSVNDEDIVQVGMIGLWKALSTYEENRKIKFSTYATKVIMNSINMEYRRRKKHSKNISLETQTAFSDSDGKSVTLEDMISDNLSGVEDYSTQNLKDILQSHEFDERERNILYYKYLGYKQIKIANKLDMSQAQVSRLEKRIKQKLHKMYGKEIDI